MFSKFGRLAQKPLVAAAAAAAFAFSGGASAALMRLDLTAFGGNTYDAGRFIGAPDANSTTASFTEFGFSQLFATSVYDLSDGSVLGAFYDTNIASELAFANVPAAGLALDGITPVSLVTPNCAGGQCDIDALSPLVPPLGSDNEGFLQTWDLQVEYHFDGILGAGGPVYTGGTFNAYFRDLNTNTSTLAITGALTSSTLAAANLDLYFDITYAAPGFLNIWNGSSFVDAAASIAGGGVPRLALDTNVNPPIPTADQLLAVFDGGGNLNAIRQTTLDGSITGTIPEPSSIALMGLALLGLGAISRKKA